VAFIRQVTTYNKFNSYEIFFEMTRKRWSFNTGDCLLKDIIFGGFSEVSATISEDDYLERNLTYIIVTEPSDGYYCYFTSDNNDLQSNTLTIEQHK
jgi:hypothetical protein